MRRTSSLVAVVVVALALLLGACSSGSGAASPAAPAPVSPSPSPTPPRFTSYVALGDSYTSGPLIPMTDVANGCFRSDHNYPSLLAQRLHVVHFRDVSCSAADTTDLRGRQTTFGGTRIRPQLDAVTPGTDLVTLGIGGNDFDLFSTLVDTCTGLRASDPSGAPCARQLRAQGKSPAALMHGVRDRVVAALRAVEARAPHATVVLVGYLRLAPTHGTCPGLPLAAGDYRLAVRSSRLLDVALASAARRTGTTYVDMYTASAGHDVCSAHPWVNGRRTLRTRAFAYHPFAVGMRAVADRVERALAES